MNELENYKYEFARKPEFKSGWLSSCVREGFDAAIALDLPIKFAEFCFNEVESNLLNGERFYITKSIMFPCTKELYLYWIDNIYKPNN